MRKLRSPYALWLALGLTFALAGIGFDSPDEHFPTLEAAGRILFQRSTRTWEWDQGLRSFLQPYLLAAWLKPFVALGLENRTWLDSIARVFNVFWFLPLIWSIVKISGRKAQWWVAASWPLLAWGTRHGSDTFAIPPLFAGFAVLLEGPQGWRWKVLAGALLGLAFDLRFPTGVISVAGVGVAVFLTRKISLRDGALAGAGFLPVALAACVGDWILYSAGGAGRLPVWEYFQFNILMGAGRFHGSPWYELLLYSLLLWVPPLGWLALPRLRRAAGARERWAALTWLATSLVFACVRHKELRFVFPLVPLSCMAAANLLRETEARAAHVFNALMIAVAFLLYRDPHGGLVHALDAASAGTAEDLWISGVSADFPEFYVRKSMKIHFISEEEARRVCGEKRPGALVTSEPCPSCTLVREVDQGLGYRLRQRISSTPAFRYVYRCY